MMKSSSRSKPRSPAVGMQSLMIAGMVVGLAALLLDVRHLLPLNALGDRPQDCQGEVNQNVVISREQLAQFLTVSERDSKAKVEQILQSPYCLLPSLDVRAGATAERAVYPLAFDRETWLVVLYEGEEYAGYQFRLQQ